MPRKVSRMAFILGLFVLLWDKISQIIFWKTNLTPEENSARVVDVDQPTGDNQVTDLAATGSHTLAPAIKAEGLARLCPGHSPAEKQKVLEGLTPAQHHELVVELWANDQKFKSLEVSMDTLIAIMESAELDLTGAREQREILLKERDQLVKDHTDGTAYSTAEREKMGTAVTKLSRERAEVGDTLDNLRKRKLGIVFKSKMRSMKVKFALINEAIVAQETAMTAYDAKISGVEHTSSKLVLAIAAKKAELLANVSTIKGLESKVSRIHSAMQLKRAEGDDRFNTLNIFQRKMAKMLPWKTPVEDKDGQKIIAAYAEHLKTITPHDDPLYHQLFSSSQPYVTKDAVWVQEDECTVTEYSNLFGKPTTQVVIDGIKDGKALVHGVAISYKFVTVDGEGQETTKKLIIKTTEFLDTYAKVDGNTVVIWRHKNMPLPPYWDPGMFTPTREYSMSISK